MRMDAPSEREEGEMRPDAIESFCQRALGALILRIQPTQRVLDTLTHSFRHSHSFGQDTLPGKCGSTRCLMLHATQRVGVDFDTRNLQLKIADMSHDFMAI